GNSAQPAEQGTRQRFPVQRIVHRLADLLTLQWPAVQGVELRDERVWLRDLDQLKSAGRSRADLVGSQVIGDIDLASHEARVERRPVGNELHAVAGKARGATPRRRRLEADPLVGHEL